MSIKIAPSILSADFCRLGEQVAAAEAAGADYIHCDVMDGYFVPNITIGPLIVRAARRATTLPLDVHLMIEHPERYISDFFRAGANNITVHVETSPHLHRLLEQIKALGAKASVSLNPATPLCAIEQVLPYIDMVLLMTVNPGFGGQSFIETMWDKIERLRSILLQRELTVDIEVDGGINLKTIRRTVEAGANVLVAGSAIFAPHGKFAAVEEIMINVQNLRAAAIKTNQPLV